MKALDLFCGAAGGWSLGLEAAGIQTVAGCERDPWRRAVFQQIYGVPVYDDVKKLTAARLRRDLGGLPDVIVGSPPCQDASTANGRGAGVDGARTGLFFQAIRLVRECHPLWGCFENVPGIRTRGADRVIRALEAQGYACWPLVVGAWHAGANHERRRAWFIFADAQAVADADRRRQGRGAQVERTEREAGAEPHRSPAAADADGRDGEGGRLGAAERHRQEPEGDAAAHANGAAGQSGRAGRTELRGERQAAVAAAGALHDADADGDGVRQHEQRESGGRAERVRDEGQPEPVDDGEEDAADAAGEGFPVGEDQRGHGSEEQPSAIRDILAPWGHWNGGPPDLDRVDDGLSSQLPFLRVPSAGRRPDKRRGRPSRKFQTTALSRDLISAYGDSLLPQEAFAIAVTMKQLLERE